MTKISGNKTKIGKGNKVKLGSNDAYELYQDQRTGKLTIVDTRNNSRAYVDKEERGQIGGKGAFIKALQDSEPMADTGKTYSTVQGAVDAASSWVFVPPGTYNESVTVNTDGLTLRGAGYNSLIDGESSGEAVKIDGKNVYVSNLSAKTSSSSGNHAINVNGYSSSILEVRVRNSGSQGIRVGGENVVISGCTFEHGGVDHITLGGAAKNSIVKNSIFYPNGDHNNGKAREGIRCYASSVIISNNIFRGLSRRGTLLLGSDSICIGNRVINCSNEGGFGGIATDQDGNDCIIANNRVSDSSGINDAGSNNILDGNLTGSAN